MQGGIYVPPMTLGSEPGEGKPEGDTVPSYLSIVREQAQVGESPAQPPLAEIGLTPRQSDVLGLLHGQASGIHLVLCA